MKGSFVNAALVRKPKEKYRDKEREERKTGTLYICNRYVCFVTIGAELVPVKHS